MCSVSCSVLQFNLWSFILADKNSKSVLYLHLLHCKTLQSTLKLFCENLEPTNAPTLSITDQASVSTSNLSNHFLRVAIAAVDTIVFSTHAYKTEQVGLFISKDLSLPSGVRPNSKATVMEFTLAFTKFLLYYFHDALTADPKKVFCYHSYHQPVTRGWMCTFLSISFHGNLFSIV